MKVLILAAFAVAFIVAVSCEPSTSKRPLKYYNWPLKNGKQVSFGRNQNGQKRTLVVQIRSDQPVPLVLKGRPGGIMPAHSQGYSHAHLHMPVHSPLYHNVLPHTHLRGHRPLKLTSAHYLKTSTQGLTNPSAQKHLKIKIPNSKQKSKPSLSSDKPFKYEKPQSLYGTPDLSNTQKLPLETHANFISDHFTPIHTIPAPNLALQEETYLPPQTPKPQKYHATTTTVSPGDISNEYQVVEEITNDHTVRDPISGSQKLFAPDPDPSLPASKIRPATEPFNQPSNGKPLPIDVQNNYISPAQPLLQIVNAQQAAPEIYPIQYSQQAQLQHYGTAVQAASLPLYNPTYLVQQSNNLYTQHKQQLFHPENNVVEVGYVNADLTQEVASDGQILQAAKDVQNDIQPILDSPPHFAALIAAPVLNEAHNSVATAPFRLANIAATSSSPEGGFVVSNFYNNPQDSSQLLQAYAEEEAHRQPQEIEQASFELHLQQQQNQLDQLRYEQQQQFEEFQLEQQKQQQQLLLQQQQQNIYQLQQEQLNQQQQSQQQALHHQYFDLNPRLSQHQEHTGLRIFVPDEETTADLPRLQKRAGTVEDVKVKPNQENEDSNDSFQVTSSVEVSNGSQNNHEGTARK